MVADSNVEVCHALAVALQAGENMLLWGGPGEGKTSLMVAMAQQLGWHHEVVIGSIRDATDFGGFPVRSEGGVRLEPPTWSHAIIEAHARGQRSMVFLDELTTVHPSVQAAMLRVVLERVVGDAELPPDTVVVAAANPVELATDGVDLSPALANRFGHLEWEIEPLVWARGLQDGFSAGGEAPLPVLPIGWEANVPRWRTLVAEFIRRRPELLRSLPAERYEQGRAWPSPRTWEMVTRLCGAVDAVSAVESIRFLLIKSVVGEGAAIEFSLWLSELKLPDPELLLNDPHLIDVLDRGDQVLASVNSAVAAVRSDCTEERWQQCWDVLFHAATSDRIDVAATAAVGLLELRNPRWELPKGIEVFAPILARGEML